MFAKKKNKRKNRDEVSCKERSLNVLREIKEDYLNAMSGDPFVRRVCNVIIEEFKSRTDDEVGRLTESGRD